jgi:predicted dehydrogenase
MPDVADNVGVREAQVVALCDRDESRLRRAEAMLKSAFEEEAGQAEAAGDIERAADLREDAKNLRTFTSTTEMFRKAGLDLVDIITTPRAHAPISVEALEAGAHVFCQKPMTRTWLECLPVLEAVEKSGKLFGCAENMIYESPWYDAKRQVDSGAIGEPLLMFLSFGLHEALPVRWSPEISGGGALLDMGVHALVTSWFVSGFHRVPARAKATAPVGVCIRMPERLIGGRFERICVEDDAHVLFEFEDQSDGSRVAVHVEAFPCHIASMPAAVNIQCHSHRVLSFEL